MQYLREPNKTSESHVNKNVMNIDALVEAGQGDEVAVIVRVKADGALRGGSHRRNSQLPFRHDASVSVTHVTGDKGGWIAKCANRTIPVRLCASFRGQQLKHAVVTPSSRL
jgi:hypothetical protein